MRGTRATWVIFAAVVGLAVASLLEVRGPVLPGTIRLAVLPGPGVQQIEQALTPLTGYLQPAVRRAFRVEIMDQEKITVAPAPFDLAILPAPLLEGRGDLELLAWVRPAGLSGWRNRCFVVRHRGPAASAPRVVMGDAMSWSAGHGCDAAALEQAGLTADELGRAVRGTNPYDHGGALSAFAHGAFDVAVVRESDLRRALAAGWIDNEHHRFAPLGTPRADFALVAAPSLSEGARRRVREAVLNLDHYRYDRANLPAVAVLQALGHLGMAGFAPVEVLPSLRR